MIVKEPKQLDLINNLRIRRKFTWLLSYFVVTEILTKHLPVGSEKISRTHQVVWSTNPWLHLMQLCITEEIILSKLSMNEVHKKAEIESYPAEFMAQTAVPST
jgi:hypothetical protein